MHKKEHISLSWTVSQNPLSNCQTRTSTRMSTRTTVVPFAEDFNDYLNTRKLANETQYTCRLQLSKFFGWYIKPLEAIDKRDILKYLQHLQIKGLQNATRASYLRTLWLYFDYLQHKDIVTSNPTSFIKIRGTKKKRRYPILDIDARVEIADLYYHEFIERYTPEKGFAQPVLTKLSRERNYVMFLLLIYQGLGTEELQPLTQASLDLRKAKLSILQSKKKQARTLDLDATQLGVLIHYLNVIRPQFFEYIPETDALFPVLPNVAGRSVKEQNLQHVIKPFAKQLKKFHPDFLHFQQIRASVICNWIKTYGLRKAQYLAGHKKVSSTQEYTDLNLVSLKDAIGQFNPY